MNMSHMLSLHMSFLNVATGVSFAAGRMLRQRAVDRIRKVDAMAVIRHEDLETLSKHSYLLVGEELKV